MECQTVHWWSVTLKEERGISSHFATDSSQALAESRRVPAAVANSRQGNAGYFRWKQMNSGYCEVERPKKCGFGFVTEIFSLILRLKSLIFPVGYCCFLSPLCSQMVNYIFSFRLICRIPWTEETGGLQSMGSQRVGHDWATNTFTFSLSFADP